MTPPVDSPSDSPGEDASEAAQSEVLDPCAMVPEATWQKLIPKKRRSQVRLDRDFVGYGGILISETRLRYACVVSFDDGVKGGDDGTPMTFGYYPGDFTPGDVQKFLEGPGGTPISDQVGFLAYTTGDFTSSDAIGLVGNTGLFVSVSEESDSIIKGGRTRDRLLVAVMQALGDAAEPAGAQPKVLLPSFCPAVGSPELTPVLGRVDYARGGDDLNGQQWCVYRDTKALAQLRIAAYHFTDEYFDSFYDETKGNPNGVDMFDGPPGAIRMVSLGDDGSADSIVLDPDSHYYVNANLVYVESKRRKVDRKAFIELTHSAFESITAAGDTVD